MAKEHPPDQAEENEDIEDVLSTLDGIGARAASGAAIGIIVIVRDQNGADFCASAGFYRRNPEASLLPALQGLMQLHGPAKRTRRSRDLGAAPGQMLH